MCEICTRHANGLGILTKRWIEIDSKMTMTTRRLPNNSESEEKAPRFYSIHFNKWCWWCHRLLEKKRKKNQKKKKSIHWFLCIIHYTWCLVFHNLVFRVAPFRFVFFSHRFQSDIFPDYHHQYLWSVCLLSFDWHENLCHTFFNVQLLFCRIDTPFTIVTYTHIRLMQWTEMFYVAN